MAHFLMASVPLYCHISIIRADLLFWIVSHCLIQWYGSPPMMQFLIAFHIWQLSIFNAVPNNIITFFLHLFLVLSVPHRIPSSRLLFVDNTITTLIIIWAYFPGLYDFKMGFPILPSQIILDFYHLCICYIYVPDAIHSLYHLDTVYNIPAVHMV